MNRRRFLRNTSALGALTLAGCMADADDNSDDSGGSGGTPNPGDEDTPEQPAVAGSSVELVDAGCSGGEDSSATVSMDEETLTVSFSGQVTTANPCYDVTLERVEYLSEEDRLAIGVGTESTDEVCVDCVGLVEFEGSVEFEGALPGEASVSHGDTFLTGSGDEGDDPGSGDEPEAVELVGDSFTVTESTSGVGSGDGTADVSFNPEENTVVVTGTIIGADGCTTAELGDASYDPSDNRLSVDVVTTQREDAGERLCTEALVALEYQATFTFEGGIPNEASVSHDGRGIVGAGYDTASATPPEDA